MISKMKNSRNIIIHLDDAIVPAEHFQFMAWKTLFSEIGVPFDRDTYLTMEGKTGVNGLDYVLKRKKGPDFPDVVKNGFAIKQTLLYRAYLSSMRFEDLSERAKTVIPELKEKGNSLFAYTLDKNAEIILDRTGLWKYFDGFSDLNISPDGNARDVYNNLLKLMSETTENTLVLSQHEDEIPHGFLEKCKGEVKSIDEI